MNSSTHSVSESISQFNNLSKRVSKPTGRPQIKKYESQPKMISPREEIYKSMIREIRNNDIAQMNSLVHKASGILRLTHHKEINKNRKVTVSWDIDGRRILTYEDKAGTEKSLLQRQTDFDQKGKKNLLASLNEPIFGLNSHSRKALSEYVNTNNGNDKTNSMNGAADGELPRYKMSKIWEDYIDSGDVSKLWQSEEGILSTESQSEILPGSTLKGQLSSEAISSVGSKSIISKRKERPPWKTVYRTPSSEHNINITSRDSHYYPHSTSALPSSSMTPSKSKRAVNHSSISRSRSNRTQTTQSSFILRENDTEKVERVQHVCVVNGSIVTFKNFGFENFTNWFGDESKLEANQQRCQPKIHQEMDFTNVKTRDIKIRLLDGCKLEVTASRRVPGTSKPIRLKESYRIPEGYRVEDLLMCRTKTGKLVVEEITPEPIVFKSEHFKLNSSKSKARWRISRK